MSWAIPWLEKCGQVEIPDQKTTLENRPMANGALRMMGPSSERGVKMSLGLGRIHDIFFVKMLFLVTVLALFFGNTLKLNAVAEG